MPGPHRSFVKALAGKNKTDRIDALMLADAGRLFDLPDQPAPTPELIGIRRAVIRRHRSIIDAHRAECRLWALAAWVFPDVWRACQGHTLAQPILDRWPHPRSLAHARVESITEILAKYSKSPNPARRATKIREAADTAINDAGGIVVEKPTKTKRNRIVSLDAATIELLTQHLDAMDERAAVFGVTIPSDGFVFSLDPACQVPMRPELMTRRMRQLRKRLGIRADDFDATILALRKWTSSELMDAGFNPSTVSGRQGHSVQVMLHHYSTRRRSADCRAPGTPWRPCAW